MESCVWGIEGFFRFFFDFIDVFPSINANHINNFLLSSILISLPGIIFGFALLSFEI